MVCTIVSGGSELSPNIQNENASPYLEIKQRLREIIWELYCGGYDTFWLNCEYGVPLWAAEIICALKLYNDIELNIAMPYEEQAARLCEEYRDRYFTVHSKSDRVVIVNTQYHNGCYGEADETMTAEADLLAVFGEKGSCAFAESCAKKNKIKIMYF